MPLFSLTLFYSTLSLCLFSSSFLVFALQLDVMRVVGQGLNLTCSALAADSSWVIASSPIACKLYHLSWVCSAPPPFSRRCSVEDGGLMKVNFLWQASESRQGAPTVKLVDTKKLLPPLSRACFTQVCEFCVRDVSALHANLLRVRVYVCLSVTDVIAHPRTPSE
jgi:hypothetical protein